MTKKVIPDMDHMNFCLGPSLNSNTINYGPDLEINKAAPCPLN